MTGAWPSGEHPDSLLSAHADGELTVDERSAVDGHLAGCEACRLELDDVQRVRHAVRGLAPVEPPAGFVASLLAAGDPGMAEVVPLRRRRWPVVHIAASVAASVLLLVSGVGFGEPLSVSPAVADVLETHLSAMSVVDGMPERTTAPDMAAPYRAPRQLPGGYELAGWLSGGRGVQLVYDNDRWGLSVFEQPGHIDWDDLPDAGHRVTVDGDDAWLLTVSRGSVLVVQRGDLVHVVVGDGPPDHVLVAARSLPGPRSLSLVQRFRRACDGVLEDFSVVGAS